MPRHWKVYGGVLDLINGTNLDNRTLDFIKFCALFYKHIIVPDVFFHCYGPLHSHISKIQKKEPKQPDPITVFLENGILVPSLREGTSLLTNWDGGTGIEKGRGMILSDADGRRPLDFVDRRASHICKWPAPMASPTTTTFGELLYKVAVDEGSPYTLANLPMPSEQPPGYRADWLAAKQMAEDFIDLVAAQHALPVFRRFPVEELIRKHVGIQFQNYQELYNRVDPNFPVLHPAGMAYHIVTLMGTAYQAYHSLSYDAVGGLFPRHYDDADLYKHMLNLQEAYPGNEEPLAWVSLKVSALTAKQIVEIRKLESFELYLELLAGIQAPKESQTFAEVNQEFVHHVVNVYLPAIIARYPEMGSVESKIKNAGDWATLLVAVASACGWTLKLGDIAIFTLLSAIPIGAIIKTSAPPVAGLLMHLRNRGLRRQFEKTNYSRWG